MDEIADFWMEYILGAGITLNSIAMDFIGDRFGDFAAMVTCIVLIPLTVILLNLGALITAVALVVALLLSPLILPFTIYKHIKENRS